MASAQWTKLHLLLLYAGATFTVLFVGTTLEALPWQAGLKSGVEAVSNWTARAFFGYPKDFYSPLGSDTLGLLFHLLNIGGLSLLIGLLLLRSARRWNADKMYYGVRAFMSYYVAFQLFSYGFNKVFKYQFFLPEPNTLYTTVGQTPRDLLFWSVMGSAYGYTVFAGVLEVLAAILLLFRKTRLLGALVAAVVLTHVVAVNFGFNISVKIHSLLYLSFVGGILLPHVGRLYAFIINNQWVAATTWQPNYQQFQPRLAYATTKTLLLGMMLYSCLYPYFEENSFNDDWRARPAFHGAYAVESFVKNDISYPALPVYTERWQRAFVHRRGYWVVQFPDERYQDYLFSYDKEQGLFELIHTETKQRSLLNYVRLEGGSLRLEGILDGEAVNIFLKKLNWRALPLLQYEFNWTVDALQQ
jgi:hypothetical protein